MVDCRAPIAISVGELAAIRESFFFSFPNDTNLIDGVACLGFW